MVNYKYDSINGIMYKIRDILPHILYIPDFSNSEIYYYYYIGGERHNNLTVGKIYRLSHCLYSPTASYSRIKVCVCKDDDNTICRVSLENFGDITKFRNSQINKILELDK